MKPFFVAFIGSLFSLFTAASSQAGQLAIRVTP